MNLRTLKEIVNKIPEELLDLEALVYDPTYNSHDSLKVVEMIYYEFKQCIAFGRYSCHDDCKPERYEELKELVNSCVKDYEN